MLFVYCQYMYFNGLNSDAKFYFHSFNTLKVWLKIWPDLTGNV